MKRLILIQIVVLGATIMTLKGQIVSTQFGQIQGSLNGTVYQFLGIPFAKPPIGELRWKAPQNPNIWPGILTTDSFEPECPQKYYKQGNDSTFTYEGNEDCLYLNVWTPQIGGGKHAVLVFIHGGGNQQGGASETDGGTQIYSGKNMAERGNAVIVTIQYRLGPLGFLVYPGLEEENINGVSGNYGILDQLLALKWVKKNVSNFGGDTTKIMVFGESAGGVDVGDLLTSPLAAGLFQRAGIESGAPVLGVYNDVKNKGIAFVDSFIKTGTDSEKIVYMRTLPADSVIKSEISPIAGGIAQMNWQPVLDNIVFTQEPIQSVESGKFNKVPLLIGSNSDEMSLDAPTTVTPIMLTALINSLVPSAYKTEANLLYPPGTNNADARQSYVGILTDAQFTSTVRRTAECVSQNQTEPVWRYFYTYAHTTVPILKNYGAYHGSELTYIFNTWENTTLGSGAQFTQQDDSLQKVMLAYWVNFANTGNPNDSGLVKWSQYQSSTDSYLEMKATPVGGLSGVRTAKSNLWDAAVGFTGCTSSVNVEELKNNNTILVYPIPTNEILYVKPEKNNEPFTIFVYDFTGKKIISEKNINQVNLSNFPTGIYLMTINQGGEIWKKKIIKE